MLTVTLTPDLEAALAEQARRAGTTPERLALESLRSQFLPVPPHDPAEGSLAEFLDGFVGCIRSAEGEPGGAQTSPAGGRAFAAGMAAKRRAGRL